MLVAALLTGCNSGAKQRQQLALEGISRLQREFNAGKNWLDGCGQLRATVGPWRSFAVRSVRQLPGAPVAILVVADALFEKGTYHLESYWYLNKGRAELYALYIEGNGNRISIPPSPPFERKLMDPPVTPYPTHRSSA